MSDITLIPDRMARELAETTFDRNVVVVAGAGTGKTTLLVNRLIHLLVKEPDPVPITRIVALTFTNKAATEMKLRLRERLTTLLRPGTAGPDGGAVSPEALRTRYGLSMDVLVARADAALQDIEKAQIGTLHSFAAHLLRLHPLESGVDPAFQEDDGSRFEEHFTAAWDVWADRELSRQGSSHALWRSLLCTTSLEELRMFARSLCSELVDVPGVSHQLEQTGWDPLVVEWLTHLRRQAQGLLDTHDRPKRRKIELMLAASITLFTLLIEQGAAGLVELAVEEREVLRKDPGKAVAGWEAEEFNEAHRIIDTASSALGIDHRFFMHALKLLMPFVALVRRSFIEKGWLSFDGLLARARTLLLDHRGVRERIKQDYRAVLVDEFQDTDPVQYEIILAVSERQGRHAGHWKDMSLEPGKLFIVGDPKQSIYAFRRADIEAFDRVVDKIEAEQGVVHRLTTNFRSDAAVLEPVNDVFDRLFVRRAHVQPANVRLEVRPNRRPSLTDAGVRFHIVTPGAAEEPFDAAGGTRAEADALACWLNGQILSRPTVKPGHVALLFRKLTQAEVYLDALRRHGIAYVIEGEKHFYRRQEIIDLISVLRVLDNPHDGIALVGVLRSALGGLTDRELYDVRQAGWFDYRRHAQVRAWPHPCAEAVARLYEHLAALHGDVAVLPLADAVQHIFDSLPILELAAASLHGEQAVANLLKAKQLAAASADRPHVTLSAFVDLMVSRLDEQPDEAESPLVEEASNAVQILTIHKAKGLEFPIVVLPGLHQGGGRDRSAPAVSYDWSSGTYGLRLGDRHTLGSVLVADKLAMREEAEHRRVLYVGMTRAKDLLILSGSLTARSNGDNLLDLLQGIGEGELGAATMQTFTIGTSSIPHLALRAPERQPLHRTGAARPAGPAIDSASTAALWEARTSAWTEARQTPRRLTPSRMTGLSEPVLRSSAASPGAEASRLTGVLAHRVLQHWNFADDPAQFPARVTEMAARILSPEQQHLADTVVGSLKDLLTRFGQSELYAMLGRAAILGREVPFLMPWDKGQVMEGVIDILYRLDGRLWVADYKTDAVRAEEAPAHAERYRVQSEIYKTAATRCLGEEPVSFQCLFLRCATVVAL
jgi:ATP-dependent helicase/nuclease subunit A